MDGFLCLSVFSSADNRAMQLTDRKCFKHYRTSCVSIVRKAGDKNGPRQDIFALYHQCLPPGSEHGKPKGGKTRFYGRIIQERIVTKISYQPSIKIILSSVAFRIASSGIVRLVHVTRPLMHLFCHYKLLIRGFSSALRLYCCAFWTNFVQGISSEKSQTKYIAVILEAQKF